MKSLLAPLCASALLILSFATSAAQDATGSPASLPTAKLWIILDLDAEDEARIDELKALKASAEAGDHASLCVLGRLAYSPDRHPAKLPNFELGDANTWLSRCVIGGDLDAMLVMAELKLAERKPLDAMIWMQGYLKMASALAPETVNIASAYKAGILARIERAYGSDRPTNEEVLEYVAGFMGQFGERIAKGFHAGGMVSWLPMPAYAEIDPKARRNSFAGRFTREISDPEDELVSAMFLIEVSPDGKPAKVMVAEAYPDSRAARTLRNHALSRRFLASEETTYYYAPVFLDNKAFDLLPDAKANRRPPRR